MENKRFYRKTRMQLFQTKQAKQNRKNKGIKKTKKKKPPTFREQTTQHETLGMDDGYLESPHPSRPQISLHDSYAIVQIPDASTPVPNEYFEIAVVYLYDALHVRPPQMRLRDSLNMHKKWLTPLRLIFTSNNKKYFF